MTTPTPSLSPLRLAWSQVAAQAPVEDRDPALMELFETLFLLGASAALEAIMAASTSEACGDVLLAMHEDIARAMPRLSQTNMSGPHDPSID